MDIALLNRGWNRTWSDTMVNLEARKLVETANRLSAFYLQDGLTRIKFVEEIKQVVDKEFETARRAKTDEECIACIKNLRAETDNLHEQERLLRTRAAQLYAKVEFVKENNKIVGYVISAVNVVLSGVVLFGGFMMLSTMGPIGMLAGAVLIADGMNGLTKEVLSQKDISPRKVSLLTPRCIRPSSWDLILTRAWLSIMVLLSVPVCTAL